MHPAPEAQTPAPAEAPPAPAEHLTRTEDQPLTDEEKRRWFQDFLDHC